MRRSDFQKLYDSAGTHSPNLNTIQTALPDLTIRVDACFIGNPYASDLFARHVQQRLNDFGALRDLLRLYPSQNREIAKKIAPRLGAPAARLFIGNGSIEIIQMLLHQFSGKRVLINLPTFSSYYEFLLPGSEAVFHRLKKDPDGFALDEAAFLETVARERVDTVVLINPNNPDGQFLDRERMARLLEALRKVPLVVVDESFIHFADPNDPDPLAASVMPLLPRFDNVVLLKSLSKDLGIAGVRAGFAVLPEAWMDRILKTGYLWNISAMAEFFFELYARDDFFSEYLAIRQRYLGESLDFFQQLQQIPGLRIYPSRTNFILAEIIDGRGVREVTEDLLFDHGVYVRNCEDKLGLDGHFLRISAGKREENDLVVAALAQVMGRPGRG